MFKFDNINKVLEGKAMVDTTIISQLGPDVMRQILDAANTLDMSEKLGSIVKNLMSKCGIVKDVKGEPIVVNAICFFRNSVKGIGAMLDDPIFRLYELDVTSAEAVVTDYVVGGIIYKTRDIANYNKTRQFHKDDIVCIIPLNNQGYYEYIEADEFIMHVVKDMTANDNTPLIDGNDIIVVPAMGDADAIEANCININ